MLSLRLCCPIYRAITNIIIMKNLKYNTNSFWHRVATDLQFVKDSVSAKCSKTKYDYFRSSQSSLNGEGTASTKILMKKLVDPLLAPWSSYRKNRGQCDSELGHLTCIFPKFLKEVIVDIFLNSTAFPESLDFDLLWVSDPCLPIVHWAEHSLVCFIPTWVLTVGPNLFLLPGVNKKLPH